MSEVHPLVASMTSLSAERDSLMESIDPSDPASMLEANLKSSELTAAMTCLNQIANDEGEDKKAAARWDT